MTRRSMPSAAVLVLGLVAVAAVHAMAPVASPLFDGVVVEEPYRYLTPPSGEAGSPTSAAATLAIVAGASPAFAVYTSETPPQAELLAHGGELAVVPASGSVVVAIDPIPPPAGASRADLAGNVYRFAVTDTSGSALALVPGQTMTVAVRGPAGISADATIARFANGAWQVLATAPAGLPDLFITNADGFGDFALVGSVTPPPAEISPDLLIAALIAAVVIAFLGLRFGRSALHARPSGGTARRRPTGPERK